MKKVIFFLLFTGVAVAEQYLCIAEHSVGFSYDKVKKEWENTNFKAYRKYVISERDGTKYAFQVTTVGEDIALIFCESDFDQDSYLSCTGLGDSRFNKNNGRYLYSFPYGYYDVLPPRMDGGSDTPLIEIGKCSPF